MFFSGIDSQISSKTAQHFKQRSKIFINQRYLMKKILQRGQIYNLYEGIDLVEHKFVHIYVKQLSQENIFSKQIKQQVRGKIAPSTLWSGTHKIQKSTYMVQVQQKFGPSMREMFEYLNRQINDNDFIHLFYQMLKLVQKIGNGGFVYRQLSPSTIVFDPAPEKNQLYVLNIFPLKKKNQQCYKLSTRYCSKGCHLGLNANVKDDLESLCYVMIDVYSNGKFLKGLASNEYQASKIGFDPKSVCPSMPAVFMDFYHYVMGMNYTDQINYFHWKNMVLKTISKQLITKPYSWMTSKSSNSNGNNENSIELEEEDTREEDKQLAIQTMERILAEDEEENIQIKLSKFTLSSKTNSMKMRFNNESSN